MSNSKSQPTTYHRPDQLHAERNAADSDHNDTSAPQSVIVSRPVHQMDSSRDELPILRTLSEDRSRDYNGSTQENHFLPFPLSSIGEEERAGDPGDDDDDISNNDDNALSGKEVADENANVFRTKSGDLIHAPGATDEQLAINMPSERSSAANGEAMRPSNGSRSRSESNKSRSTSTTSLSTKVNNNINKTSAAIVEEEMQRKGFKKWSRSARVAHKPGGPLDQVATDSSNYQMSHWDKMGIGAEFGNKAVQISSYKRRDSTAPDLNRRGSRRGSVMNVFFGELGSRRFSQDLRLPDGLGDPDHEHEEDETAKVIFFQVFIPFLIAGFGNVGAGIILDNVQHWEVFRTVTELFILVASFLGFKGNLEMTLAARLATQANTGKLDDPKNQWRIGIGNVALIQSQAIVVAFLAALIAIGVGYFKELHFDMSSALLICATSLCTASITGLFLASLMVVITIVARRAGVNPDNVSTLIAAFLGDISAVALLSGSAKLFFDMRHLVWVAPTVIVFFLALLPVFLVIARKNEFTHDVVGTGWYPIIIAMTISSAGGFIFDFAVNIFETIAVFQPIINGVGSNLVAVQASRISTYFHQRVEMGTLPAEDGQKYRICQTPLGAFFGKNPNVRTARLLLLMSIPGHMMYVVTIRLIKSGEVLITLPFLVFYLLVAIVQVVILLYLAHILVPFLWRRKIDPDNAAIPGIMATGDLIGTLFLTAAYFVLQSFGDPNTSKHTLPG